MILDLQTADGDNRGSGGSSDASSEGTGHSGLCHFQDTDYRSDKEAVHAMCLEMGTNVFRYDS